MCENLSGVELDLMEFRNWEICHCSGDLMDCIYFSHLQLGFKFILIFHEKGVIIHGERPSGIFAVAYNYAERRITLTDSVYHIFVYSGLEIATRWPNS